MTGKLHGCGFMAMCLALMAMLPSCSRSVKVTVSNPLGFERNGEIVEVSLGSLSRLGEGPYVVCDKDGKEIPSQVTSDSLLIFPVDVKADGSATYTIAEGTPAVYDTLACGSFRPDRKDDLIWENDLSGYRTYGPALQASGEKAYGYDVFTKSVSVPVMKKRFDSAIYGNPKVNFHLDHGDGMDSYGVGPTLGDGATAIVSGDSLVYPWCWTRYEILDNGPLRFKVRLSYSPVKVGADTVVENRVITCDAHSLLNKAEISYERLPESRGIAAGIVVHAENPEAYAIGKGYAAYADLGDRNIGENGEIYCGTAFMEDPDTIGYFPLQEPEGQAVGHVLAIMPWNGGRAAYWFGSGWSKSGIDGIEDWKSRMDRFTLCVRNPLEIKISK
jgi:hypothetical protein